jgi:hypothetical protein
MNELSHYLFGFDYPSQTYWERLRDITINRHQAGAAPEEIWELWSNEQRADFIELCEPTMERFSYLIP